MGRMSDLMIELQEEQAYEEMREWILDNYGEIDEGTIEWYEAEESYYDHQVMEHVKYIAEKEDRRYQRETEDNYFVESKTRFDVFSESLNSAEELIKLEIENEAVERNLLVMTYGHVVAATEGYLFFTFTDNVLSSEELMKKLVETDPEMSGRKFLLSEIFERRDNLKQELKSYLEGLIFHKLAKVKIMYNKVLDIDFGDITFLHKAIAIRHDCVHRAGFKKDGSVLNLTSLDISDLLIESRKLVELIEGEIS